MQILAVVANTYVFIRVGRSGEGFLVNCISTRVSRASGDRHVAQLVTERRNPCLRGGFVEWEAG